MKQTCAVISQAKFIALALQIIMVSTIYQTRVNYLLINCVLCRNRI